MELRNRVEYISDERTVLVLQQRFARYYEEDGHQCVAVEWRDVPTDPKA